MINTKCAYCGTAAQFAEENCLVCGGDLTVKPFDEQDPAHEWQPVIDPDQPSPGLGNFGVDTALTNTLSLFSRNLWLIIKIVVVILAPFEIVTALNARNPDNQWEAATWFLLGAVCKVLVTPALIYSLLKVIQTGTPAGIHEAYRWGLSKLFKLCICALISTILQGLGYMLCIIPGIIVGLAFAVVYPVAVLEQGSISEIFSRSLSLTRGHRMQIFGVEILLGLIVGIPAIIAGLIIASANLFPVTVVGSLASDVVEQLFTILSLVLYLGLSRSPESPNYTVLSLNK